MFPAQIRNSFFMDNITGYVVVKFCEKQFAIKKILKREALNLAGMKIQLSLHSIQLKSMVR